MLYKASVNKVRITWRGRRPSVAGAPVICAAFTPAPRGRDLTCSPKNAAIEFKNLLVDSPTASLGLDSLWRENDKALSPLVAQYIGLSRLRGAGREAGAYFAFGLFSQRDFI
ncbi:hypothetical protein EVAR_94570_1 [Eumeta japonica]|uniref:Uncharacterized protein n=1 Tax=Eumeta variegata TaxID=151549 RepID=A0A4C1UVD8_EUMVA|nr:hypothetical protein EVAR_94570_1 [Eumeta japonica]